MYRKEILYDRETHDYAMYLDGELVGFARTYHEAESNIRSTRIRVNDRKQFFKDEKTDE
jgi:hypothetical protein